MRKIMEWKIIELVCYMITSACNLTLEAKSYGPLRLLDSASRLIDILSLNDFHSPVLEKIRSKIDEVKDKALEAEPQFSDFLNELVLFTVSLVENSKLNNSADS